MKLNFFKILLTTAVTVTVIVSCTKDLDRQPLNDVTSETVYANLEGYQQAIAKVYGSFALTGNSGPAGSGDIAGIDEGTSDFLRLFWKAQELSTDEAVVGWNDPGIQDFHNMNWSSSNPMLIGLYNRIFYQITLANEFMRESTDDKISGRGISGAEADEIRSYRAEARFLRAFQYWVALDLFGNVPFVTETTLIGSALPERIERAALFNYVESELLAMENELPEARQNEYGRADKAAAQALLARLYLNAAVYTGQAKYTEAITYAKKVIDAGYSLESDYQNLFLADNHLSTNEIIFTINYDGIHTKNYGGTTFLIHGAVGDNMDPNKYGINGGWYGLRATKNLPLLFDDYSGATDKRAIFTQNNLEINDISKFSDGFAVGKYKNVDRSGAAGSDPEKLFVDTDFPLFRLAEIYLIYAEAVLRGGTGGSEAEALDYINDLRTRAYGGSTAGNVSDITVDFILDERARELYWEGFRRTDLIRYGKFTSASYVWPFKGGTKEGRGVPDHLNLYPIPAPDIVANPNLVQNPNY